jgi:hypothetical protein
MSVPVELFAERTAAIGEKNAAIADRAAADAREAAADTRIAAVHAQIASHMVDGETVSLHPTAVPVLVRVNGMIQEGILNPIGT